MKNLQKKFISKWILNGILFWVHDIYFDAWGICNLRDTYRKLVYHLCFATPLQHKALTCYSWQNTFDPFFRRHGSTRVRMYYVSPNQIYSNIILFQVEVTTVTSVHFSEWNLTSTESTSVFKFRIYETKRWETTIFKPFYFVYSDWDRLPDCMWPGLDPIKGVHVLLGASLNL